MLTVWKRSRRRLKCATLIIFASLIFEFFIYSLIPWLYWPKLPKTSPESVKVLVVADPQLLGEQFTIDNIFGYLARWDSDRFIARTFHFAYHYVTPDAVIFLGDNFDEGEFATDEEFSRYLARYKNVFSAINFDKAIVIPGDNDIGGENEPPLADKAQRFDKYFKNDLLSTVNFVEFVKVSAIMQSRSYLSLPKHLLGTIRIVLSHIPLLYTYSSYTSEVISHLRPNLILSAHEHISVHLMWKKDSDVKIERNFCEFGICNIKLSSSETHEIMIPTCSYRMGTSKMGYGVLVLTPTGELAYTVLWLPSRFLQLMIYAVLGTLMLLLLLVPFPVCVYSYLNLKTNVLPS